MTNGEGCPVAVSVYAGNTGDEKAHTDTATMYEPVDVKYYTNGR